jgi:hypothetical protein
MKTLRTPDERFADHAGYPFAPHYADAHHFFQEDAAAQLAKLLIDVIGR